MKTIIRLLVFFAVFAVASVLIYVVGIKIDSKTFAHAPIALSCMYGFFLSLTFVGSYYFAKEIDI